MVFACDEWLAAIAGWLATRFAGAKLVARFLRLFAAGRTIIGTSRTGVVAAGRLTFVVALRAEIRAAFAARIGAGGRFVGLTTDFPALSRAGHFLGGEDFEFGFGFNDSFGGGRFDFERCRRCCNRSNFGDRG